MATTTVAPVSAPAPSAPAPAAAPPVSSTPAPSTPSVSVDSPSVGSSDTLEATLGKAWENAKAAVPLDGGEPEPAKEPGVTEPAAEVPKEEPAAAPAEPEAKAEPEKKEPVATPEEEFKLALDDDGEAASPESLYKELKADPAAQKFFEDRPELKNKVMAALRRDTENREIRKIVPDVETAKEMSKGATLFSDFDIRFLRATTPEGYKGFIDKWVEEAIITGADGKPVMNADGTYKLHPSLPYIMNTIYQNQAAYALAEFKKTGTMTPQMTEVGTALADHLLAQAKLKGDERLEQVAELFKEALAPQSSASEEIPEHLKTLQDSLTAKEKALQDKEQADARQRQESERTAAETARTQAVDRAEQRAADSVKSQLKPLFATSGLSDFETDAALNRIGKAVDEAMEKDGFYQSQLESARETLTGQELEKRVFKLMMTWANVHIGDVAAKVIREAKGGALNRQTQREATVDGQKKASTADPRGTSIAAAQPSQKVSNAQIEKEYMDSHNGEKPSLEWVLGEVMKRNMGTARRA